MRTIEDTFKNADFLQPKVYNRYKLGTREEIKNTTGIQGAMVLRAVQELDKVDLIEYNMDTSTAKLKKRLFPKPGLKD